MIGQAVFNNLSSMVVFIALARLLTPQQFGIVAFATIFIDLGRVIVAAGIPDALIQRVEWDDDVASTAFWTNLSIGLALCAILSLVGAPLAASLYDPTFSLVLAALSLSLLIDGSTAVHGAKLRREFRYKTLAARGMLANTISGIAGVALAYAGWGVWALVASRLFAASIGAVLIWTSTKWRPRLTFAASHVRGFLAFSLHLLGTQLLAVSNSQIVGLVIGAVLGPAALAQYRVGTRALNMLVSMVITPLQSAATSAFSRMQDTEGRIGAAYFRLTRTCSLVACPVFLGAAAVGPDFVHLVFGKQWGTAGQIMAINGLVVGPVVIMYFFTPALASMGKSALALQSGIAASAGNLIAASIAAPFGVLAVTAAQTLRAYITLPFSLRLLKRGLSIGPVAMIKTIMPALTAAAIMAAILAILQRTVLLEMSPLERILIMVAVGVPLYFVGLFVIDRRTIADSAREFAPLLGRLTNRKRGPEQHEKR